MSATPGKNGTAPSRILAVDDHPLTREGLARVLAEVAPHDEVIEAETLVGARATLAADAEIRLVVLDPALPDGAGIEAIAAIIEARPEVSLLVLSAEDDPTTARAALDAGARGFISRRAPIRLLVEVLRLVLAGGTYIPPEALRAVAARTLVRDTSCATAKPQPAAVHKTLGLTARQLDVLALLVQGKPNKLICRALELREGTIKTHIAAIYRALGVANRTQVVYAVQRLGVDLPAAAAASPMLQPAPPRRPPAASGWVRDAQFA
jgi:DNA-binding NarL/FixJ family response regulator